MNAAGVPGGDVAGTVVSLGAGCQRLQVGDRVWANRFAIGGGMAEYALAAEEQCAVMPGGLGFAEAGTIPVVGGTALQCLLCLQPAQMQERVRAHTHVRAGNPCPPSTSARPLQNMTVAITSGSGGTGYLAVQIAKALGASKIITAATGATAIEWMRALGAAVVVDYMEHDIFEAVGDDSLDAVRYAHSRLETVAVT